MVAAYSATLTLIRNARATRMGLEFELEVFERGVEAPDQEARASAGRVRPCSVLSGHVS